MQYAGGILLPPVQKLVATLIFAKGKNANESPAGHHRVSEDPAGHHRVSEDPAGHHRVSEDPAGHQRKAKTQRVTLCLWQSKRRIPSLCKEPVGQRWVFFRLRKKMQTTVAVPDIFVGFEKPSSSVDLDGTLHVHGTLDHQLLSFLNGVFGAAVLTDKHTIFLGEIVAVAHFTGDCHVGKKNS